jgi:hypothetical protein
MEQTILQIPTANLPHLDPDNGLFARMPRQYWNSLHSLPLANHISRPRQVVQIITDETVDVR